MSSSPSQSGSEVAPDEPPTAAASSWALVGVLLLYFVFSYLDRMGLTLVVDPVRASLGISDVQIGLLVGTAVGTAYALAGVPIGFLADRYDRRVILFFGVVLWGLATAACGFVHNFEQFFFARMMVGVGEAALMPTAHSLISDSFSRRRLGLALSVYSLGVSVGAGVTLIFGGSLVNTLLHVGHVTLPLLGEMESWRMVFFATGLPGAALGCLIFLFKEPVRKSGGRALTGKAPAEKMLAFLLRRWKLWLAITVAFGGMNVLNSALVFWQPTYMSRFFGWNPAQYGLGLGLTYAVGGAVGLLLSGWAVDRLVSRGMNDAPFRYYLVALVLSSPFVLFALLTPNVWGYLGLIWMAKFAMVNFLGIGSLAVQMSTPPHLRARMAALFTNVIVTLMGASLGASLPALIARDVLHDEVRLGRAIAVTLVVCTPLAIAALLFGMRHLREAAAEISAGGAR